MEFEIDNNRYLAILFQSQIQKFFELFLLKLCNGFLFENFACNWLEIREKRNRINRRRWKFFDTEISSFNI